MKRLIASILTALALAFANVAVVRAEHAWEFQVSEPRATTQARTYNVEYITLSEEATDQFTVELFQNGVVIASQMTTKPYGDSGSFTVTVPANGTYMYFMRATSSLDGSQKTTGTRTVTVTTPPPAATADNGSNITVNNVTVQPTSAGEVASDEDQGQVGEDGISDEESNQEDEVMEKDKNDGRNVWLILAGIVALLGAAYYWFFVRGRDSDDDF